MSVFLEDLLFLGFEVGSFSAVLLESDSLGTTSEVNRSEESLFFERLLEERAI